MGILKSVNSYKFLLVAIISLTLGSCTELKQEFKPIKIDSCYTNINITNTNSRWEFGYNFLNFKSDSLYICYVFNEDQIRIVSYRDSTKTNQLSVSDNFLSFYCIDSTLIIVYEDKLEKFRFDDQLNYNTEIINHNVIFKDSLFLFSYMYSGIVPINEDEYLAPYRIENETINLLDTFAYLRIKTQDNEVYIKSKTIPNPKSYSTSSEYLKLPLAVISVDKNYYYYTFQKCPLVYRINSSTLEKDSVILSGYDTVVFDIKRERDIGYLRKYMMKNDYNFKLFIDSKNNIYILKKRQESKESDYEMIILNENLKVINRFNIKQTLVAEISFIKNNKLYVKSTNNNFIIYSLPSN